MKDSGRGWLLGAGRDGGLSPQFWLLVALLAGIALFGGSNRGGLLGLIILRPLALIVACLGLLTLSRAQLARHWYLFAMLGAAAALMAAHLIPLPYELWSALPGRGLLREIDAVAGIQGGWRPLTMVPAGTLNALFSMVVPFAVLIVGVQLSATELQRLLPVVIGLVVLSALLAVLQLLGIMGPIFYYGVKNDGHAVGLLVNRNHHAVLLSCLLMLLGLFAGGEAGTRGAARSRVAACLAIGLLVLSLILLTGSRGGLLFGIPSAVMAVVLFQLRSGVYLSFKGQALRRILVLGGAVFAGISLLVGWTIASGRAESVRRLLDHSSNDAIRGQTWAVIWDSMSNWWLVGSGVGSYERVYRVLEPAAQLRSSYSNHAHNDWLEVVMTAGLPGVVWLLAALIGFALLLKRAVAMGRAKPYAAWVWAACAIIAILGLSSVIDYPLRVPMVAAIFIVACLWARLPVTAGEGGGHVGQERLG